ncbi:MAG TPA: AI-2E family transporter [Thermoanaerobaculia bacterium]|nr:AI-2E family transporter [Thermoanaerobaculia bacterium]
MAEDMELRIPFGTLVKVALFALLVAIAIKLWPVILMVIVAVLIAVLLHPVVVWLQRHRVHRGLAIGLVAIAMFALLGAFLFWVVPLMLTQIADFAKQLPAVVGRLGKFAPRLTTSFTAPTTAQMQKVAIRGLVGVRYAVSGLTIVILILVISLYLLNEGAKVYEWLIAFASPENRTKLRQTGDDVCPIIFAYMRGQAITCCLCGGVALVTCLSLHIQAAVVLAVLAFLCDLVPVVGTIVMTIPAVSLALLSAPWKAIVVLIVYVAYHLTESYWIIPRVYGHEMRLSTLTVLLAVTVGGVLQGAVGAVLILPFVAAYPVIERIWLAHRLQRDTLARHRRIGAAE